MFVRLQRGGAIWAEENDGGKVRGEPSRDFAKVGSLSASLKPEEAHKPVEQHVNCGASSISQLYELDNDPKRKEFLDELFVFMQKRGEPHSEHFPNGHRRQLTVGRLRRVRAAESAV